MGQILLEDFRIKRHLGSGAFANVYLAESWMSSLSYAVKHVQFDGQKERNLFLSEARQWLQAPLHQNIVKCYFIRWIDRELFLFGEHVADGSLRDRISSGSLYRDPRHDSLAEILRIALQVAFGLRAAHRNELLHLDIKPANILMAEDGTAKVADFGLAAPGLYSAQDRMLIERRLDAATSTAHDLIRDDMKRSVLAAKLISVPPILHGVARGETLLYASPEQAERRLVSVGCDVWSWAVMVMEMFSGERRIPSGTLAADELDRILDGRWRPRVDIPMTVGELLQRCFLEDPSSRPSLDEAVKVLSAILPGIVDEKPPPNSFYPYRRVSARGDEWADPRPWLSFAHKAADLDADVAVGFWPPIAAPSRATAMADLVAFSEVQRILESLLPRRRSEIVCQLADVYLMMGVIQGRLGNHRGAISSCQHGLKLVGEPQDDEEQVRLVSLLANAATAMRQVHDNDAAHEKASRALAEALKMGIVASTPCSPSVALRHPHSRATEAAPFAAALRPVSEIDAASLSTDEFAVFDGVLPGQDNLEFLQPGRDCHSAFVDAALALIPLLEPDEKRLELSRTTYELCARCTLDVVRLRAMSVYASELDRAGKYGEASELWKLFEGALGEVPNGRRSAIQVVRMRAITSRVKTSRSMAAAIQYAKSALAILDSLVYGDCMDDLFGDYGELSYWLARYQEMSGDNAGATEHYAQACEALERAVRFGAAEWSGVFLEAILHRVGLADRIGRNIEEV
ncbi:protein kinase [Geodermatophilus sp. SYSU D00766]